MASNGRLASGVLPRGSWQPWQAACSPGWNCVPERIEVTAKPFSSKA